jgi:hypothetical protein
MGGMHSSPRVHRSALTSIEAAADLWSRKILSGVRAPGTGIPFVIMLGTLRKPGAKKSFCAIYRRRPGYVLTFSTGEFGQWIFSGDMLPELQNLIK